MPQHGSNLLIRKGRIFRPHPYHCVNPPPLEHTHTNITLVYTKVSLIEGTC